MPSMSRSRLLRREEYLNEDVRAHVEKSERVKTQAYSDVATQRWEAHTVFDPETTRMAEMMMLTTTVEVP